MTDRCSTKVDDLKATLIAISVAIEVFNELTEGLPETRRAEVDRIAYWLSEVRHHLLCDPTLGRFGIAEIESLLDRFWRSD